MSYREVIDAELVTSGTLPLARGGTGQGTAQLALNSLAGAVTDKYYLRGGGTNVTMAALAAGDLTGQVPVANGGTALSGVAAGSVLAANTVNVVSAVTSTSGTTILKNVAGTVGWGAEGLWNVTAKTADYTASATDEIILVDATSAAVAITLPTVPVSGKEYTVKKTDASANTVTVTAAGTAKIDGAATSVISFRWTAVTVIGDGTDWFCV